MEQTLGKRIVQHRKELGLTQDQLAERLGVTAQAVSKWENDLSCPDISMLPKLAEIFGITTDELLGIAPRQKVHEATILEEEAEPEGLHLQKDGWEFEWHSGRKNGIALAIWVLLVGCLLLASNILGWGTGLWEILWPSALLVFGVFGLFPRISFFRLGCALFGAYFLLDNLNAAPFQLGKDLLLPILLVLFGLSLLADALRSSKKPHFRMSGKNPKQSSHFSVNGESFRCSTSFGENRHLIQLSQLSSGEASVSFGEMTVDLSGCGEISENCVIHTNCAFGQLNLLVPSRWRVDPHSGTTFATLEIEGEPAPDAVGIIRLEGKVNFGETSIQYI